MITAWNEARLARKTTFAQWAQEHLAPHALAHDNANTFNAAAWQSLARTPIWHDLIDAPRSAETTWDFVAALEGIAATALDSGFVLSVIAQAAFIRAIRIHASARMQDWLLPLLREAVLTATAIAEPHSGTDAMATTTFAQPTQHGYRIDGSKTNIAHAGTAGIALLTGRIHDEKGLSLFITDTQDKGYTASQPDEKMGNRSLPTASITLSGLEIDDWQMLGDPGKGQAVLTTIGLFARASYAIAAAQLPRPVLNDTLAWVQQRSAQGKPLQDAQHVQRRFTDVEMALQQARWMGFGAMSALLAGDPQALALCSAAKLQACQSFQNAMENLLALKGSIGYQRGDAERLLRDAIGWTSVGGTAELHRMLIWRGMA